MAFSQNLLAGANTVPFVTSNYVPGLRLEFARFYWDTGHFKLNFSIENSNFSQFFVSGIHIHTFPIILRKKIRFIGTLKNTMITIPCKFPAILMSQDAGELILNVS